MKAKIVNEVLDFELVNTHQIILENVGDKDVTIAIDFDGVIHSYKSGWNGDIPKDPPMEGVREALEKLKKDGWTLKILSTRKKEKIREYLKEHDLDQYISGIYNTKIPAEIYLDDRGVHFSGWDQALKDIKNFKKG